MSESPSLSARRLHLGFLDGVRGLAVACVLCDHSSALFIASINTSTSFWAEAIKRTDLFINGHIAVDVFIVLSGFCLALPVTRSGMRLPRGTKDFYLRRAYRILPPYYICMGIMLAYGVLVKNVSHQAIQLPTGLQILSNVFLLEDLIKGTNTVNGVFWSVAIEWKIYFLFPLFLYTCRKANLLTMLATAGVIGIAAMALIRAVFPENNMARMCPWYVLLFAMGVAAATIFCSGKIHVGSSLFKRWKNIFRSLVMGSIVLTMVGYHMFHPDGGELQPNIDWATVGCDIIIGVGTAGLLGLLALWNEKGTRNPLTRLMNLLPLVRLGRIGYSVYLIHPLAILLVWAVTNRLSVTSPGGRFIEAIACMTVSLILGYLFYVTIEVRFLSKSAASARADSPVITTESAEISGVT